jgi:hypothetical protein
MTTQLSDGVFLALLLAGSVASVALCLWLAQAIAMNRQIFGGMFAGQEKIARTGLGVLALAGSVMLLTGVLPGNFLNPWTAMAASGTALLGMFTIVSAQRGRASIDATEIARSEYEPTSYQLAQPQATKPATQRKAA